MVQVMLSQPFQAYCWKIVKHTLKIVPCLHRKVLKYFRLFLTLCMKELTLVWLMPNIKGKLQCKNSKIISAVNYLRKKHHLKCLTEYASDRIIFLSNTSCIQLERIRIVWSQIVAYKTSTKFTCLPLNYNFSAINNQQKRKWYHCYACNILGPNHSHTASCTLQKSKTKIFTVIF